MSKPAAALGDTAAHGGTISLGSPNVLIGGKPAARVGDPVACGVHGTASIKMGSLTVFINGTPAARMGDITSCLMPGIVAVSVPVVLGPPPVPAPKPAPPLEWAGSLDPKKNGKTHEQNDKTRGGASVMHAEGRITDVNGDGLYDTMEGGFEGVRMRNDAKRDYKGVEFRATNSMDVLYANAKYSAPITPNGQSISGSAEAGMIKWGVGASTGLSGSDGRNPFASVGAEANVMHANAAGDLLVGDDGNRVGLIARGEAGAEALKGDVSSVVTVPLGFGKNIQFKHKTGIAGGAVGAGAGGWFYFDKKEKRLHCGAMGKLKLLFGAEEEVDVSLGQEYQADPAPAPATKSPAPVSDYKNTPGMGTGGIAGTVLMGLPTVLIGG
jgi:uncharacterized Zn-binding protein involved in type VI secretion